MSDKLNLGYLKQLYCEFQKYEVMTVSAGGGQSKKHANTSYKARKHIQRTFLISDYEILSTFFVVYFSLQSQPLTSDPLVFYVPVGQREHLWSVISLTVLSTMTGCAVVVWSAIAQANPL